MVSTDYYPTLIEIAGGKPPAGHTLDGVSIAPVLRNPKKALKERDICWYYPLPGDHFLGGKSAMSIRDSRWKLIESLKNGEKQLFDLEADPSETRDLASTQPDVVRNLANRLAAWRKATVKEVAG